MIRYVARGDVAIATDASETPGVPAAVGLGSEADSIDGELPVAASAIAGVGDAATEGVFG